MNVGHGLFSGLFYLFHLCLQFILFVLFRSFQLLLHLLDPRRSLLFCLLPRFLSLLHFRLVGSLFRSQLLRILRGRQTRHPLLFRQLFHRRGPGLPLGIDKLSKCAHIRIHKQETRVLTENNSVPMLQLNSGITVQLVAIHKRVAFRSVHVEKRRSFARGNNLGVLESNTASPNQDIRWLCTTSSTDCQFTFLARGNEFPVQQFVLVNVGNVEPSHCIWGGDGSAGRGGFLQLVLETALHFLQGALDFGLFLLGLLDPGFMLLLHFFLLLSRHPSIATAVQGDSTLLEKLLHAIVLVLKHSDELRLRVLVDLRDILDLLGAVSIPQGADTLLEVGRRGRHRANHDSF
mmetsp:Transcript_10937/g.23891  ORF Transcript_10937/g.23891 Transcript_10937/m.23891 type:complete len:347 (-) Transcript_10937:1010-2050(-)